MVKVNLPKVEEETRAELNIIKARRKHKSLGETLNYLVNCEKQYYLPEFIKIVVKSETLDRLKKYDSKDESWDKLLNDLMDENEIKDSKKIMNINQSITDCIRQDHCKYDHTKDILGVLTDIPVDADCVLWSLRIKNPDRYNCFNELEILIILRLMKDEDMISGCYDKESECWLWSRKGA